MAAVARAPVLLIKGYRHSLTAENRKQYDEKLKFTAGIDPYSDSASFLSQSMDKWPEIEFPDIMNYLLFSSIWFTKEQLY